MNTAHTHEHVLHENPYLSRITSYVEVHYPERLAQLNPIDIALLADGLHEIELRFGENSDSPKQYHNFEHTWDACADFCEYADVIGLDETDFADGLLAVAYHDWEQDLGPGRNEAASGIELARRMEQAGYSVERQQHAQKCVLVTDVEFDEYGLPIPKNLMTFDPDPTLLAVSLADMNGIALRGERTMIDHAYRLAREVYHLSFDQVRQNPREFMAMLAKQFYYVGHTLSRVEPAVRHHVEEPEKAETVLLFLDQRYHTESSMAINAAKSLQELIQKDPRRAVQQIAEWGMKARDEHQFVAGVQRFTTKLALGRRAARGEVSHSDS